MSRHHQRTIIGLALVCALACQTVAEDEFSNPPKPADCLCFRAAPLSQCKSFLVTQTTLFFKTEKYLGEPTRVGLFATDVGWMTNLSENYALGITAYQASDLRTYRLGIRPHMRRWLGQDFYVDFAPGLLIYCEESGIRLFTDHSGYDGDAPGIAASLTLSAFDLLAITAHYERFGVTYFPRYGIDGPGGMRDSQSYTADYFSIGVSGQSYIGLPFAAASIVLGVVALLE